MSLGDRRLRCPVGDGGGAPGAGAPPPGPADALAGVGPVQTAQHALTLLPGMDAVLRSIFGDVERATRRVDVETYIYRDDVLGSSFADVMGRAAARGVRARLLYDPLGSHETDGPFFEALRRRGIEVRAYRPLAVLLGAGGLLPRDHARVIVIDDCAYTGGAAWGDEWLPKRRGGEGWHDVCMRVEGPCVGDFAFLFEQRWGEANGGPGRLRDFATGDRYPDLELVADTPDDNARVYARYRDAIRRAKERVWIENAYFFPPAGMLRDLVHAAARGVDVQILLPGETDLPIVKRAARAAHAAWIARGLRLFEYQRAVLHAKLALVDRDWCTIGTFNANPTSLSAVNEVNLFVFDPAFVARVADLFARDRADSRPVSRRALAGRSLVDKAADWLAHGALSLLDQLIKTPPE
ncbi:cardiolipin synthetase [Sorangium cellulosum]|uniref:Cardiolipin synthetase n=1 Tax=Sorangium cellulosum TaxID=56 RepID=A0A4P2QEC5_SORCE|nr:phosphatidylserine/phosphatidylglycerophosphate/cardiolipin synthase family protein [Sorangium cellulosum]AUX27791.1 cardiolipin synthetase [Sorangium cellulosum]